MTGGNWYLLGLMIDLTKGIFNKELFTLHCDTLKKKGVQVGALVLVTNTKLAATHRFPIV